MDNDVVEYLLDLIDTSTFGEAIIGNYTSEPEIVSNIWMDPGEPGDPDPFEEIEENLINAQREALSEEW